MSPIEIVTIIVAVAIVAGVVITYFVRKARGKSSGCSGCAGCPYAGNCAHSANTCTESVEGKGVSVNNKITDTHGQYVADENGIEQNTKQS